MLLIAVTISIEPRFLPVWPSPPRVSLVSFITEREEGWKPDKKFLELETFASAMIFNWLRSAKCDLRAGFNTMNSLGPTRAKAANALSTRAARARVLVVRTMTRQNIGSSQCKSQILENGVVATALRSVLLSGVYSELFEFTLFEYFILLWSGFTTGLKLMIYLTNFPSLRLFPYVEGGGRGCTGVVCLINTSLLTWCESVVK